MVKRSAPFVLGFVGLLVGVGLAALVLSSSTAQPAALPSLSSSTGHSALRVDAPAPDFTLNTFDGRAVSLSALRGKRVLINFWASWCPPCLEETPALIAAYNELRQRDPDIEFIGVGTNDEPENLRKFAENNRIPYLVVDDSDSKVSDAYGVRGMPTTVFVDSSGVIRRIWNGAITQAQVIAIMRDLR
jgi:cytochrome c biogenesis protein CcmG/thiol:disulfide interchange protein DsbE